ncbi:MAG: hypothetical protein HY683_03165, partial [Chloroflexi bacterium]|nr:hypothetical protein [Chloroflexota bacterium]
MSCLEDLLPEGLRSSLTGGERKLLECLPVGKPADLRSGDAAQDDPAGWQAWGPERTVRAALLAFLCTSPDAAKLVHSKGVQVAGARIEGQLDLEGATALHRLAILHSAVPEGIVLFDAHLRRLVLDGSHLGGLQGDRLVAAGGVSMRNVHVKGVVRLLGAVIGGQIACTGGHLENPGGNALNADGLTVKGGVFLDQGFEAKGEVRLLGATIGGQIACTGGHFENPEGYALSADRATVKGNDVLDQGFEAKGVVRLLGAVIDGQLACRCGHFVNPEGVALTLERAEVAA